ncbi:MAG: DASH family cryptochrome [Myxococcota bacterium]
MRRAVVWFRNDLRVHDHQPLRRAVQQADEVVPLFVVDPRLWEDDRWTGRPRMASHRARFWLESVADLRRTFRRLGGDLLIRRGVPRDVVPEVARAFGADVVHVHEETCEEERRDEQAVRSALEANGQTLRTAFGSALLHRDDLPFPVPELPEVFTQFRREVERAWSVRDPKAPPEAVSVPALQEPGELPSLDELRLDDDAVDPRSVMVFRGGESEGLRRLRDYVFEADALRTYKETRNDLLEPNESSKLSPWLALGCLSPRTVYAEVQRYEAERVANDSTYWLVFELLWRDYFKFLALKEGRALFELRGVGQRMHRWQRDRGLFQAWADGCTGFPFVDAFMRELKATGFMSNRGRQNVASFLAKTLQVDWRWGAAYFEAHLLDYDVASNWGNWQYVAGVGTDPRDRIFNVVKQGRDYDPDGAFVKKWLPELQALHGDAVHTPWHADAPGYPGPVVDPSRAFLPAKSARRSKSGRSGARSNRPKGGNGNGRRRL